MGSNPATPTTRSSGKTQSLLEWLLWERLLFERRLRSACSPGVALVIVKAGFDNPSVFNKRLRKGAGLARRLEYPQPPTPEIEADHSGSPSQI